MVFLSKSKLSICIGVKVVYNTTKPVGNRVVSVDILSNNHYEPLKRSKTYHIITSYYLNNGGDGYTVFKKYKKNHV